MGLKRLLEMFSAEHDREKVNASRKEVVLDPIQEDDRHRMFSDLKPEHRVVFTLFWETGVLAPFSVDTAGFTRPNTYV